MSRRDPQPTGFNVACICAAARPRARKRAMMSVGGTIQKYQRKCSTPLLSSHARCQRTTMSNTTDWILVTGMPGCGKTTAVRRMTKLLQDHGIACRGFVTNEVLEKGSRIGFDVVTVPEGRRGVLSRKQGLPSNYPKTGKYYVDVKRFQALALPTLQDCADDSIVYVVDEIGRMELHSTDFQNTIRSLLTKGVRMIGSITAPIYGHRVPFCDEISETSGVEVYKLTKKNRDAVVDEVCEILQSKWGIKDSVLFGERGRMPQLLKHKDSQQRRYRNEQM